jgi:hypothetical protein
MITDKQTASEIGNRVLEVNRLLNEAVSIAHARCPTAEFSAFRLAVGQVLGELLLTIVNPLYQEHPDIKPEGLFVPEKSA